MVTQQPTQLTFGIKSCARCGRDHHMPVVFIAFDRPFVEKDGTTWTFWGQCPTTLAPILLRYENRLEEGEQEAFK